jgi:hypothetical protein
MIIIIMIVNEVSLKFHTCEKIKEKIINLLTLSYWVENWKSGNKNKLKIKKKVFCCSDWLLNNDCYYWNGFIGGSK